MQCIKCSKEAVEYIRYNGSHLCEEHFLEYVERRVKKEIRQQVDLDGKSKVAVALSGGKDSSVALYIVHQALKQRRDLSVVAITVDEGIAGYRPQTMEKARELTDMLGVEHHFISFQDEVGKTMDDIAKATGQKGPCTYCGVIRRRCMNKVARDVGADVLATGLNLDDTAQSILMNFTRGDVERLARLGPHQKVQPGLIPGSNRSAPSLRRSLTCTLCSATFPSRTTNALTLTWRCGTSTGRSWTAWRRSTPVPSSPSWPATTRSGQPWPRYTLKPNFSYASAASRPATRGAWPASC